MGQGTAQVHVVTPTGDVRLHPLGADQVRHEMEKERIWAEAHARRAAEHAQRMAEKARRVSERLAEKAEERAAKARRWQVKWSTPQKTSSESLENERLAILKMLAEGKINAEQAESLLNALEG
jgi:membrane protein involved in colicin uptake